MGHRSFAPHRAASVTTSVPKHPTLTQPDVGAEGARLGKGPMAHRERTDVLKPDSARRDPVGLTTYRHPRSPTSEIRNTIPKTSHDTDLPLADSELRERARYRERDRYRSSDLGESELGRADSAPAVSIVKLLRP